MLDGQRQAGVQITDEMVAAGGAAIEDWREAEDSEGLALMAYIAMEQTRTGAKPEDPRLRFARS